MENKQQPNGLTSIVCDLVKQEWVKPSTVVSTVVPLFEDIENDITNWNTIPIEQKTEKLEKLTEKMNVYHQIQDAVDERNIELGISASRMFQVAVSFGDIIRSMNL